MRGTTWLLAAACGVAVLLPSRLTWSEEEVVEAPPSVRAADHLGTQRHALLIGIDDHADWHLEDLKGAEASARAVRAVLVDPRTGGVPESHVELLLGAEATAQGIRAALGRLRDLPKEATVIVFFSGHVAGTGDEACWVSQDAKRDDLPGAGVPAAEVRELLDALPARRVVLLLDGVSGTGADAADGTPAETFSGWYGPRHATLAGLASEEQTIGAAEGVRSVFTHHLVEGLAGEADDDADGVVALGDLGAYLDRALRAEARERPGFERPVADLEGALDPARFLLALEPEEFALRLEEDAQAELRRRKRLEALAALLGEGTVTGEQARVGRHLLGGLVEGFDAGELEERTMFLDLAEGRLAPEHLTGALAAIRREDRRTLVVPDAFETIQAAVDAAQAGDTVLVKEGRYDEHVALKTGLCLRGEGEERTVLHMVPGKGEVLLAEGCAWGVIERLQLSGAGGEQIGDWSPDGIHLKGSSLRIRNCLAYACLGGGVYAEGEGSRPHVRDCVFQENKHDGLCFSKADGGTVIDCVCRSNGAVGIQIRDSRGPVSIRGCLCDRNGQAGIGVCGGTIAVVEDNDCQNNGGHGILAWDEKTSVTLDGNSCSGNTIFGIFVVQGASAVGEGNECRRNRESGILVSGLGTQATLVGNSCLENDIAGGGERCGIVFTVGAAGEARSNVCEGNLHGILVKGAATSVRVVKNECRGNEDSGIAFTDGGTGHAAENRCERNGHGITVSRSEATLEANVLERNTANGVLVQERGICKAAENRCTENERAGVLVTGMGTRAELTKNTCSTNQGDGIRFARGAGGTADDNECAGNQGFGVVAVDSGTRPTFRRNRCTDNARAGLGAQDGAAPVITDDNVQSGNGN